MERERDVWKGESQEDCMWRCQRFVTEGIGFRVLQNTETIAMGTESYFVILVPEDFYGEARDLVKRIEEDAKASQAEFDEGIVVVKEDSSGAEDVLSRTEREKRSRTRRDEKEMTLEVWKGRTDDGLEMVEACLRELEIANRTGKLRDGTSKIFVPPEDEKVAREIVREVRNGSPPE